MKVGSCLRGCRTNGKGVSTKMICIIPKAAHRQMPSICGLGLTRGIGIGVETRERRSASRRRFGLSHG